MKKLMLTFLILTMALSAQEFKKTATAGFSFLQIPATARTAALAEASIALSDQNSASIFNNPAALGFMKNSHSVSVSYAPWFADIKNYATSYAYNTGFGVIGVGLFMLDYGEMPRTVLASGQKVYSVIGNFNANSLSLGLSYSRMLTDRFSFGVQLKYVQEKIDIYKADNILFDGGVLYYTGLSSLRIAASIQNFGVNSKFINDEFKMPAVLRLGAAAEVLGDFDSQYRVTLIAEAVNPNNGDERVNVGSELGWKNIIILRGGYKFFSDEESFSFGIGVNSPVPIPLALDFAYADYGRLGNITRFTLQLGI